MNYKDWLIPELKALESWRASLANVPDQIEELERSAVSLRPAAYDSTPVLGGGNRREDALIANIAERERLAEGLRITETRVRRLDRALAALNAQERHVLEYFYIDRRRNAVELLMFELGYEKSQVYRIKDDALLHLARIRYGLVEM